MKTFFRSMGVAALGGM